MQNGNGSRRSGGERRPSNGNARYSTRQQPPSRRGAGYGRQSHAAASRRSQRPSSAPIAVIAIALIAIVALAVFAFRSCSQGGTAAPGRAADEALEATEPAAAMAAENDGSVVLTLFGDEDTIVLKGEDYIEPGAQAVDRNVGQITADVHVEGNVDTSKAGDYQVTYRVQGSSGAVAVRTRNVHVVESMDADTDGIPVLMYHWVYDDANPPEGVEDPNYISASKLEEQIQWLESEGYYYPSFQELRAYIDGTHSLPAKSVILTFDDGEIGFLTYGGALFNKYKVPATSFIIGDDPNVPGIIRDYSSEYVAWQSHSFALHQGGGGNIGRGGIIYATSYDDIIADENTMTELIGEHQAFAYPFGDVSDQAPAALAAAGDICAFTVEYGNATVGMDPMRCSRIRVFGSSSLGGFIGQVESGE